MAEFDAKTPVILSFSHQDPCGNTGIQADIECASSLGCYCTPVITSLLVRDTLELKGIYPVDSTLLVEQARAILEDIPVNAIKIGFPGSVENVEAIHSILMDYPEIAVILDTTSSLYGHQLTGTQTILDAIENLLLPYTKIITSSLANALQLAQRGETSTACVHEILESGCEHALITVANSTTEHYENHLYNAQGSMKRYQWNQLDVAPHIGDATLNASITCYLAHQLMIEEAVHQAQVFTYQALIESRRMGMGQQIPNRFFWADKNVSH